MMCPECCEDTDDGDQVLVKCTCCDQMMCAECAEFHANERAMEDDYCGDADEPEEPFNLLDEEFQRFFEEHDV